MPPLLDLVPPCRVPQRIKFKLDGRIRKDDKIILNVGSVDEWKAAVLSPGHEPLSTPIQESLDPQDWAQFRSLLHVAVDDMLDHLQTLREEPVWQSMPPDVADSISKERLPRTGQGDEGVYREFLENVFPYRNGNLHPRFYGWVQGNGTPLANMADFLASVMNPHLAGYSQAPALVEAKVIAWMAELMGFPSDSSGILESGGTMANVLALAVARNALGGENFRDTGLQSVPEKLTVYCSSETHGWVQKGVELLGIGTDWLRQIPVDHEYKIGLAELSTQIQKDREAGFRPICVIGNAGTVNTGAIDDLSAMADICQKERVWFHIDGAYGAMANLSPKLSEKLKGLERADSLAVDLHKWMYLPFEIACLLVKDSRAHTDTFAFAPNYLASLHRGVIAGGLPFSDRGIDLTRGFKALKAWMCIKSYGIDKFARVIEQNVDQANYLGELVTSEKDLELLAPISLNVVCLRFNPGNLDNRKLDELNLELLLRVQESGLAVPSSTVIGGNFAIRCCIVNHRTRFEDMDLLVEKIVAIGEELS